MSVGVSSPPLLRIGLRLLFRRLTVVLLLLMLSLSVLPDVRASVSGLQCREWSSRPVDDVFFSASDVADLVDASVPRSVPFLPGFVDGVALPGRVLFSSSASMGIYVHEVAHQQQMQQIGYASFVWEYASQWVRGRYSGCGPFDAYRAISLERAARHAELMLPASHRYRTFTGDASEVSAVLRAVAARGSCPSFVCSR